MIEKENNKNMKNENANSAIIENDLFNSSQQKKMPKNNKATNSSNNLKININNNCIKKNDKKNLFIKTDFKGNKKYKKSTNLTKNKNTNKKNKIENDNHNVNNSDKNTKTLNQKYFEDKDKEKEKDSLKYNENENTAKTYNNNEQVEILYSNNNLNLNKNSSLRNITNNLNFNIFPFSRENTTYIKKNHSNINIHSNGCNNYMSNTNRPSVTKHKKNYSISSSCYNTQRNSTSKVNPKNKKNNNNSKSGYLYSPKHKRIESKTIVIPEYKVKLESLKSRITNLLNVFSFLALKSVNDTNSNSRDIQEKNNNIEKNEVY